MRCWPLLILLPVAGCQEPKAPGYTLYRNSFLDPSARIHWATFDAAESDPSYNLNNCAMAARLLNANLRASARAESKEPADDLGFWCEPGPYRQDGPVPGAFDAQYPTDV